jgi:hypothetical protein
MQFRFLFLSLLLSIVSSVLPAQDLILTHEKKQRTIEAGRYLTLEIKSGLLNKDCPSCFDRVIGKLISHDSASVQLKVTRKDILMSKDCEPIGGQTIRYTKMEEAPLQYIAKKDIVYIIAGGKNKVSDVPLGDGVAMALGFVGFGHLISAPLGDGNAGLLAALGATEIALSAIIGTFSREKSFLLQSRGTSDIGKKRWILH